MENEATIKASDTTDLNSLCPPCKLLLNGSGALAKLRLFKKQVRQLKERGFELTPDAHKEAIAVICGFDRKMDEVLALLETSVRKVGE